jgi:hypothetical protein
VSCGSCQTTPAEGLVAQHSRSMGRRSPPALAGSGRSSAVARFNIRIVLTHSFHVKNVRPSLPAVHGDVRLDIAFHPLSNAAYQRIPRRMTSAVSSKLSRRDFVAIGGEGIKQVTR